MYLLLEGVSSGNYIRQSVTLMVWDWAECVIVNKNRDLQSLCVLFARSSNSAPARTTFRNTSHCFLPFITLPNSLPSWLS